MQVSLEHVYIQQHSGTIGILIASLTALHGSSSPLA